METKVPQIMSLTEITVSPTIKYVFKQNTTMNDESEHLKFTINDLTNSVSSAEYLNFCLFGGIFPLLLYKKKVNERGAWLYQRVFLPVTITSVLNI